MDYSLQLSRIHDQTEAEKEVFDYQTTLKETAATIKSQAEEGQAQILTQVGMPLQGLGFAALQKAGVTPEAAMEGITKVKGAVQDLADRLTQAVEPIQPDVQGAILDADEEGGNIYGAAAGAAGAAEATTAEMVGGALDATDILAPVGVIVQAGAFLGEAIRSAVEMFKAHHETYTPPVYTGPGISSLTLPAYTPN